MKRIEELMGTVFVMEASGPSGEAILEEVVAWLRWVERTFTVFQSDSEVRRIDRGELTLDDCHPEVRGVLTRCEHLRDLTAGAFDHRPPDRRLDPSALVKGWSVDRAGLLLRLGGCHEWRINAGGDLLCSHADADDMTRVGVRHPHDAQEIAAALDVGTGAVATSGDYERGTHIWQTPDEPVLRSVTVVGAELGTADALATALFAAGDPSPPWLANFPGYGVLALTDERCFWTAELDELLAAPSL